MQRAQFTFDPTFDPEPWRQELIAFLRRVGAGDAAEDLIQEAFLRAVQSPPASNPRAWLYRTAMNLWRDALRRRSHEASQLDPATAEARPAAVDSRSEQRETAAQAWGLVRKLPEKQRLTLWLRLRRNMDYDEIAVVLDCTRATARQNFYLAIRRVRGAIGVRDD